MNAAEKAVMERVQEEVREQINPEWRQQLRAHQEILKCHPGETPLKGYLRRKREGRLSAQRRKKYL